MANEFFNDVCSGGRCAKAFFTHRFTQFLIIHQPPRMFHGTEECGFRIAGRRLGFLTLHFNISGFDCLARFDGCEHFTLLIPAIDFVPTGFGHYLSFRFERLILYTGDAGGDLKFRTRIKHGEESFHNEIINLLLLFLEVFRGLQCGNDRKVIGNLGIIKNALIARHHPAFLQYFIGQLPVLTGSQLLKCLAHRCRVILRQCLGIRTWIGANLVPVVKGLGNSQCIAGGKTETSVGISLQRGEIEERWWGLFAGFAFLGHFAGLSFTGGLDGTSFCLVPDTLSTFVCIILITLETLVKPAAGIFTCSSLKGCVYFPIIPWDKIFDRLFPFHHHRQRRGLHPSDSSQKKPPTLGIECRHHPGPVDADQPVCLAATGSSRCQREHGFIITQLSEPLPNRCGGHGLKPKSFRWLFGLGVLDDISKNELPFTAGITCIDEGVDILAFHQPLENFQSRFTLGDGFEGKLGRHMRQFVEGPFASLDVVFFRYGQFKQMPNG